MKTKYKIRIILLLFFPFLIAIIYAYHSYKNRLEILSFFETDIDRDGKAELLAITAEKPVQKTPEGDYYGDTLSIYSDYTIKNRKPLLFADAEQSFEIAELKPIKVLSGDTDGDGISEIGICVYKTTKFHPVPAKRPFFFQLDEKGLQPFWLGSRLARPFKEYTVFDMDKDGIDELISIEILENKKEIIAMYDWKGFGFEVNALSDELDSGAAFISNMYKKEEDLFILLHNKKIKLRLDNHKIIFSE